MTLLAVVLAMAQWRAVLGDVLAVVSVVGVLIFLVLLLAEMSG